MLCKVSMWSGATIGWGTAVYDVALMPWGARSEVICMTALSLAIVCTAKLLLSHHQRPMAVAYQLGYDIGRRDAIKDATRRTNVTPLRQFPGVLPAKRTAGA